MSLPHALATRALHILAPEDAHRLAITGLKLGLGPHGGGDDPALAITLAGMALPSCIGLAAGFDKNAEAPDAMLRAGFGFVECGAVTPLPQAGNPRPRLFRLTEDGGVINRMGFNNQGLDAFAARLAARRNRAPGAVGVNIGANKEAVDRIADYVTVLRRLWDLADYFTINISSPNTPGLRTLQSGEQLDELLERVAAARAFAQTHRPVFLKVAPDLEPIDIEAIGEAAIRYGLDALIVGNTTLARPDSLRSRHRAEAGGLSGAPLKERAMRVLGAFRQVCGGRIALIGAGGVASGGDAYDRIRAGASAIQLYSALVYAGPGLVTQIKRDLALRLKADGFAHVSDAVGAV